MSSLDEVFQQCLSSMDYLQMLRGFHKRLTCPHHLPSLHLVQVPPSLHHFLIPQFSLSRSCWYVVVPGVISWPEDVEQNTSLDKFSQGSVFSYLVPIICQNPFIYLDGEWALFIRWPQGRKKSWVWLSRASKILLLSEWNMMFARTGWRVKLASVVLLVIISNQKQYQNKKLQGEQNNELKAWIN